MGEKQSNGDRETSVGDQPEHHPALRYLLRQEDEEADQFQGDLSGGKAPDPCP